MKQQEAQEQTISLHLLQCLFDTSDGVIVSDPKEQIVRINAAALKLFEVPRASLCQGTLYHQFLHRRGAEHSHSKKCIASPMNSSTLPVTN